MSCPRATRMGAAKPAFSSICEKAFTFSGRLGSKEHPGHGLNGMRLKSARKLYFFIKAISSLAHSGVSLKSLSIKYSNVM